MHKPIFTAAAVLGTALAVIGQTANCNGAPLAQTFSNRSDFGASFYYNMAAHLFDLNAQVPMNINWIKTWTYDSGIGNPPTPNQVGATGVVEFWTCPTTRLGNETLNPANPGSPWTLLGTGQIVIVATPDESQVTFTPPLALPAGPFGVCVRYLPTTTGPNPGPLHCLGVNPNPNVPTTDPFLTFANDGIQGTAWTGIGTDSPNLRINYTPAANSAQFVQSGDGCYFRPHGFYQDVPSGPGMPSLANNGFQMLNLGPNYLVVPFPATIVTPTSPSLTLNPPAASSSANWDDALAAPITLPFPFSYPGGPAGGTNTITISSNGSVFLEASSSTSYSVCGASYGTILPFRDGPARIAAYYHDLDPSVSGTINYDVDPANQFVRISWINVQEWGVPTAVNTMQVTLYASGNVEVAYGNLGNASAGNNAIAGFTPGHSARLPAAQDIIASLPFQTGDGEIPPVLKMDARPVLGTTPNVVTTNIKPGTLIQLLAAGVAGLPVPVDLAVLGMPGCKLHITPDVYFTGFISPTNEFIQALAIPSSASFQGTQLFFQAAPLTAGLNPLGILTSNGMCIKLGQ